MSSFVDRQFTIMRPTVFGPFEVDDRARSIFIGAESAAGTKHDAVSVEMEISCDRGRTWTGGNGFRHGSHARWGLYPGHRRLMRFRVWSRKRLEIQLAARNSITVGTPASTTGFSSSGSVSTNAGTASDRCMAGFVGWEGPATALATFTYNSVGLTAISGAAGNNSNNYAQWWRLVAPSTGANSLAMSFDGGSSCDYCLAGIPLDGVDQTTPASNGNSNGGTGTTITVNITSATGNLVLDGFYLTHSGGGGTTTVDASQTALVDRENYSGVQSAGVSSEAGATSVTMSWTATTVRNWATAGASFNAASSGSPIALFMSHYKQLASA